MYCLRQDSFETKAEFNWIWSRDCHQALRNINLLGGGCNVKTYSYLHSYWANVNESKGWYKQSISMCG